MAVERSPVILKAMVWRVKWKRGWKIWALRVGRDSKLEGGIGRKYEDGLGASVRIRWPGFQLDGSNLVTGPFLKSRSFLTFWRMAIVHQIFIYLLHSFPALRATTDARTSDAQLQPSASRTSVGLIGSESITESASILIFRYGFNAAQHGFELCAVTETCYIAH